jgi:hypothetical protein
VTEERRNALSQDLIPSFAGSITAEQYTRLTRPNGEHADIDPHWWGCPDCGRHHQPRDHSVPCSWCRKPTFEPHAMCAACKEKAA